LFSEAKVYFELNVVEFKNKIPFCLVDEYINYFYSIRLENINAWIFWCT